LKYSRHPPGCNVDGTNPVLANAGIDIKGKNLQAHDPGLILWNFFEADTLKVSSVPMRGSVLAPKAAATFERGQIVGTLVAKSVDATTEFYYYPFRNNCLVPN